MVEDWELQLVVYKYLFSSPFFMKQKENSLCILNLLFKCNLLNINLTLIPEINDLSSVDTT